MQPAFPDSPTPAPVPPGGARAIRFAASLVVLRDGTHGLEVLLLRRAARDDDAYSGACVFPGGTVDEVDRSMHAHCQGTDDAAASARLALPAHGLDFYIAAIRECFEEAGLLFAADAQGRLLSFHDLGADEHARLRQAARVGSGALLGLCAEYGWQLAVDRLAYFSHWLTPPGMRKRFDTRFFVAAAPEAQSASADGEETVEHLWIRPAVALDPAQGLVLMNVTRRLLEQLGRFDDVQACLAQARARPRVPLVMPRRGLGPAGMQPVNPGEPAYDEIAFADPDGRGDHPSEMAAGQRVRLADALWRLNGDPATAHAYFVGDPVDGVWALIEAHASAPDVRTQRIAHAPGRVVAVLTLAEADSWPSAGDEWTLGACRLRRLPGRPAGSGFDLLWIEHRLLFVQDSRRHAAGQAGAEWLAPPAGFIGRADNPQD